MKTELNTIYSTKENQQIAFLNKRLDSQFTLQAGSDDYTWDLKLTKGLAKIRFIAVGFQAQNRSSPIVNAGAGLSPVSATGASAVAGWPTTLAFAAQNNILNTSLLYNSSVFDPMDIQYMQADIDKNYLS